MRILSFVCACVVLGLFALGSESSAAVWDDDVVYAGGGIDYLLARPPVGEVRISGGGLREWKQRFKAGGFNNGPNGIPEDGGGDDIFQGVLHSGVTWTTAVPPEVGQIDSTSGWFLSGGQTGEGDVIASYPGATPAVVFVRVYPPDWQPGNSRVGDGGGGKEHPESAQLAGSGEIPRSTNLEIRNYPNPFNPSTTFSYRVTEGDRAHVDLEVYSLRGQRVATLVDEIQSPGEYRVQWSGVNDNGEKVSSGIYLYRLSVGAQTVVRKMTVLK